MSADFAAVPPERSRGAARYAVGARIPSVALRPESPGEVAAIVRECARRGLALVPWGGGVALSHEAAPPPRYDVALDLGALRRITIYEPDDYTITAECGLPLGELRAAVEARGQELPLESAAAAAATLGGVLAANASGPRRRAFGAPRDRILGAQFVTGDGELVHTGGRVVKNVAGHAVHRLLVGSRGGLGVLLSASLKLLPQPPSRGALVYEMTAGDLLATGPWAGLPRLEPAVLSVLGGEVAAHVPALQTSAPFTVIVGFEGDGRWVDACLRSAMTRLGTPAAQLRDAAVPVLWRALADATERPGARVTCASAHATPPGLAALVRSHVAPRLLFHAPAGRLELWPDAAEAAELLELLPALGFAALESRGLVVDLPLAPAAVLGLRSRLSAALDPAGTLAYGARWRSGR